MINSEIFIPAELNGCRLDQALVKLLPAFSRTQIQTWIKSGELTVNGSPSKARLTVTGGEHIIIHAAERLQPNWAAQDIALNIIHEDDALLIINKPAGMVVHPAAGNLDQTLLNALLHHAPTLRALPRAGIIHRLDKQTSGLLVVAKTAPL